MKINKPKFWDKKIHFYPYILYPLTIITKLIIFLKKIILKPKKYKLPIICVGNIYIGGTGKTPCAIFIANELMKTGKSSVIIRKYYKEHVDEYNLIKNYFNNLITNRNRSTAIKEAIKEDFDFIILDDGFQDYKIKKDLNILCFNQNQKFGNGFVLPSGPLRESLSSIKNSQIVLINGKKDIDFENKILNINKNLTIFYSKYIPLNLNEFDGKKLIAVAGIGCPENFFQLLKINNLNVIKRIVFPDHFKFSKSELLSIIKEANESDAQIIMTEKDFYRIKDYNLNEIKYLKVSLDIPKKKELIKKILNLNAKDN